MKVAQIIGEKRGGVTEVPDPTIKEDFVLVKIHAVPMCTEYKGFKEGHASTGLGHEAAGEIVEVAQPGKVKVGDRVVVMPQYPCGKCPLCLQGEYIHCQHTVNPREICGSETGTATYAQYMIKQDWLVVPIPDGMSYEHASMACCGLGPTYGAMQFMEVDRHDTVLITGMGPVGLGGVINGKYRGARVFAVESQPFRKELAKTLGADEVFDPTDTNILEAIMDATGGVGVDKAADCSGVPQAQRLCIDATRRRGTVSFVGEGGDLNITISNDMIRKGLNLHGSWHYNLADVPRMMDMIPKVSDKLDKQITHRFPMSQVEDAWNLQLTGNCGKIILNPWE